MNIVGENTVTYSADEILDLPFPLTKGTLRNALIFMAYGQLCASRLASRRNSGWWANVERQEYGGYRITFQGLQPPAPEGQKPEPRHMKCPSCGWEGDLLLDADGMPDGVVPSRGGQHENHRNETEPHDRAGTSPDHDEGAGAVGPKVLA